MFVEDSIFGYTMNGPQSANPNKFNGQGYTTRSSKVTNAQLYILGPILILTAYNRPTHVAQAHYT